MYVELDAGPFCRSNAEKASAVGLVDLVDFVS
jgi:hypothetical protein